MCAGWRAKGVYFKFEKQLSQGLAEPHPKVEGGGQEKRRASPHTLEVG